MADEEVTVIGNRPPPSIGFNIARFRSQVERWGTQPQNLMYVEITPPAVISADVKETLSLFCEAAPLPGVGFMTEDNIRRYGYGPMEKVPYAPIFEDANLTFIMDGKGVISSIMRTWMNGIIPFNSARGMDTGGDNGLGYAYLASYKDDYKTRIRIYSLNQFQEITAAYTLYDAYPIRLGEVNMGWAENNSYARLPVTFTYKEWAVDDTLRPVVGSGGLFGIDGLLNTASNLINTVKKFTDFSFSDLNIFKW